MTEIKDTQDRQIRVVEMQTVDAESLEEIINKMAAEGYDLSSIHFAMRESSRRPAMAFMIFHRISLRLPKNRRKKGEVE